MPPRARAKSRRAARSRPPDLECDALLDLVQRQTLRYFWDFAHPACGLARERSNVRPEYGLEVVTTGGSGFGVMAIIAGVARGWIGRAEALERLLTMVRFLLRADSYHGILPHFLNGDTGRMVPFTRKDDGGDLVETSFLLAGLLSARQYFDRDDEAESRLRARINWLWEEAEWSWHTQRSLERPLLALEPQQRLEHERRDPRLERMPAHLRHGGLGAALSDRGRRLPSGLRGRPQFQKWPGVLRHPAAARARLRRPALLRALLLPRPRSARPEGPLCRLLGAERRSYADQSRALRAQSPSLRRLRPRLLGSHLERRSRGLSRPRPGRRLRA